MWTYSQCVIVTTERYMCLLDRDNKKKKKNGGNIELKQQKNFQNHPLDKITSAWITSIQYCKSFIYTFKTLEASVNKHLFVYHILFYNITLRHYLLFNVGLKLCIMFSLLPLALVISLYYKHGSSITLPSHAE